MNARIPQTAPDPIDAVALQTFVDQQWDDVIVDRLTEYIEIPAKSPAYDKDWVAHGHIERVITDAARWVEAQKVDGLTLEIVRLAGRTPVMFFEIPATDGSRREPDPERDKTERTVLLYGHLDKQPEFSGWRADLGPWIPKYEDGKLYGRGGADDGYAVYSAITAIQALKRQGIAHPRCVGLIETCEESGSYDLLPYVDALKDRLGDVSLVVCLDSGCGNYEQLWLTTSLRGNVTGVLEVQVLDEGVHSGDASGVVPSSFRIMRQLFDRIEDSNNGRLLPQSFHCAVPAERIEQAAQDGGHPRRPGLEALPVVVRRPRRDGAADDEGSDPGTAQPYVGTDAVGDRRRGTAAAGRRRQRAAAADRVQAVAAVAAAGRRADRPGRAEAGPRSRLAVQGEGVVPGRSRHRDRLERARSPTMARAGPRRRVQRDLRRAVRVPRAGRHDPVDEHARDRLSEGAVHGVRRARPALERARSERVPARAVRAQAHGRRVAGHRRERRLVPVIALGPDRAGQRAAEVLVARQLLDRGAEVVAR